MTGRERDRQTDRQTDTETVTKIAVVVYWLLNFAEAAYLRTETERLNKQRRVRKMKKKIHKQIVKAN